MKTLGFLPTKGPLGNSICLSPYPQIQKYCCWCIEGNALKHFHFECIHENFVWEIYWDVSHYRVIRNTVYPEMLGTPSIQRYRYRDHSSNSTQLTSIHWSLEGDKLQLGAVQLHDLCNGGLHIGQVKTCGGEMCWKSPWLKWSPQR